MSNSFMVLSFAKNVLSSRMTFGALILFAILGLTACGHKGNGSGQTLAKVNGEDITMLQLNDELQRANIPPEQQQAARQQALESLINRQLLIDEAARNKIDRSPEVMQAIERAKFQIIAQAYLKSITGKVEKPNKADIDEYYQKHPELFEQNKRYDMKSLAVATKDMTAEIKSAMEAATSLEGFEAFLKNHGVQYLRGQASRRSTELPAEMVSKLQNMPKGKLFIISEGGKAMLISLADINVTPISSNDANPLIAQYLYNKKVKDVTDTEVAALRTRAKIEYINASAPVAATAINSATSDAKPASSAAASN